MTIKKYERIRSDIYTAIYRVRLDRITILMSSSLFNELISVFDIIEQDHNTCYYFLGYPVSCVFVADDSMKWWIVCESGDA